MGMQIFQLDPDTFLAVATTENVKWCKSSNLIDLQKSNKNWTGIVQL